jgi:hypothetical protein
LDDNPRSAVHGGRMTPNQGLELTAYSVRSVRCESGMEECGNTSDIQVSDEPLELSVVDHSIT